MKLIKEWTKGVSTYVMYDTLDGKVLILGTSMVSLIELKKEAHARFAIQKG